MISFYGAGQTGQTARVALELAKVLRKQDVTVTTRAEFLAVAKQLDLKIKEAKALGADDVVVDLQTMKRELTQMISDPEKTLSVELLAEAQEIHPALGELVAKYQNRRGPQVGPDQFKAIAKIMSEKLAERAPVTQVYIDFWKRVAQDYAREVKKVRIPWVTFDGKTLYQDYRPKVQTEIRFWDPEGHRYVKNIYQLEAPEAKLLGKYLIGNTRLGFGLRPK